MRIGFVIAGIPPGRVGGAEVQAWELARRMAADHEITIFTREYSNVKSGMRDGVKIVCTKNMYGRLPAPIPYFHHIATTTNLICRNADSLDVLFCFMTEPSGVIGMRVKKKTGLPFCNSIRGKDWYARESWPFGKAVLRNVLHSSDVISVQTPKIRDDFISKYPDLDPVVVPNGIEPEDRKRTGGSVLFVGNLLKRKGVNVLIDAMKDHKEIPVVIAGDGPERADLERLADGGNIKFLGRIEPSGVRDLMAREAKMFVLPAVSGEGMPNVIMEAMSLAIPVVASDVAGIKDMLCHGDDRSGILVAPGDVSGLKRAIVDLWRDDDLASKFADVGKKAVLEYCWDSVIPIHLKCLQKAIDRGRHE